MDTTAETPWWQSTIDYVIKAAANDRFGNRPLQGYDDYAVDSKGRLVRSGYPTTGTLPVSTGNNQMLVLGAAALALVLVVVMMKS